METKEVMVHRIHRKSVSDQVFEQMRELILASEWKIGDKLPAETDLANHFGVSRSSVRQALQKLSAIGMVKTRVGEGSFVRQADIGKQIENILLPTFYQPQFTTDTVLELRYVVEVETAGIAAHRVEPKDILALENTLERQKNQNKRTVSSFAADDINFHMIIAECTHNEAIIAVYKVFGNILKSAMEETVRQLGFDIGLPYHEKLIEAMRKHDENMARDVMREHMRATEDSWKEMMQQKRSSLPDNKSAR